jgi:predicted RNase H-like HicB family nuclease
MKTTHEYRGFVFTVTYEAKDPVYSVDFNDLPEIITSGDSLPDAFQNACEALDLHLESMLKLGMSIPQPKHRLVVESVL